jgi:hypothetical protein
MTKSATASVLEALPNILDDKKGQTFPEVWDSLIQIKDLAPMLVNAKKEPRYGVLQGISTRVKSGKVLGIAIIKDIDGAKWYKTDSGLALYTQQAEKHLKLIRDLPFPKDPSKGTVAAKQAFDQYLDQAAKQLTALTNAKPVPTKSTTKSTTVKGEEKKVAKA